MQIILDDKKKPFERKRSLCCESFLAGTQVQKLIQNLFIITVGKWSSYCQPRKHFEQVFLSAHWMCVNVFLDRGVMQDSFLTYMHFHMYMYIFFLKSTSPSPQIILIIQVISVLQSHHSHPSHLSHPCSSQVSLVSSLVVPVIHSHPTHVNYLWSSQSLLSSLFILIILVIRCHSSHPSFAHSIHPIIPVIPIVPSHLSHPYSSQSSQLSLFIPRHLSHPIDQKIIMYINFIIGAKLWNEMLVRVVIDMSKISI